MAEQDNKINSDLWHLVFQIDGEIRFQVFTVNPFSESEKQHYTEKYVKETETTETIGFTKEP